MRILRRHARRLTSWGLAGLLAGGSVRSFAAEPGLLAHWAFEGAGVADSSGHGFDLALHGASSIVPAIRGSGLRLGPADAWADRSDASVFAPGGRSWSVSLWARPAGGFASGQALLSWYRCGANPACSGPDAALYQMWIGADGRPYWFMRDDNARVASVLGPDSLAAGQWVHLAATYDAPSQQVAFFVHGARVDTAHTPMGTLNAGLQSVPLTIGRVHRTGWGVPGEYFKGDLDDVRVYERALTPPEVAALARPASVDVETVHPTTVALGRPSPQPFRSHTRIAFRLAVPTSVRLTVHDVAGRGRAVLLDGVLEPGVHAAEWDGRDRDGREAGPGVYFFRLTVGEPGGARTHASTVAGTLLR